jgi:hypothetical protein
VADAAITTAKIEDLACTTAKIDSLAVTTAKIDSLAVTTAKIDSLAVTTAKIDSLAVTEAKIGALAVTDAKINTCSIGKLTAGNMTVTGTLTTGKWVTGAAGTNRIEIDANYVTGYNAANVKQFYLSASDGKAYAGAGAVILDSSGIKVKFTTTGSYFTAEYDSDSNKYLNFLYSTTLTGNHIQSKGANLWLSAPDAGGIVCLYAADDVVLSPGGSVRPAGDATRDLGESSYKWNSVYAQNFVLGTTGAAESIAGNISWSEVLGEYFLVVWSGTAYLAVEILPNPYHKA